jgi:hypothetical protein
VRRVVRLTARLVAADTPIVMTARAWATAGVLAVAGQGLAACGGSSGVSSNPTPPPSGSRYEPRVEATLVRACELSAGASKAAVALSGCVLVHLEARISQKTLQATEEAILAGKATVPQWLRTASNGCVRKNQSVPPAG